MKNKKVLIISLIVGIPVLLVAIGVIMYSQFLFLYSQSQKDVIGQSCDSTPPTGRNNCESVIWGISIKNPTLFCDYPDRPLGWTGGHGTCQYK